MALSNAMKLLFLLVVFTITTTLAMQIASSSDSDEVTPGRNISSSEGERSLMQRMLRGKHHKRSRKGRHIHQGKKKRRGDRRQALPRSLRRPRFAGEKQPVGNVAAVVAQDGSGNFPNIKAALDASLKRGGDGRYVIHIKSGVYAEHVVVTAAMKNIMFTGDGIGRTIITGSLSKGETGRTAESATISMSSLFFIYAISLRILYSLLSKRIVWFQTNIEVSPTFFEISLPFLIFQK